MSSQGDDCNTPANYLRNLACIKNSPHFGVCLPMSDPLCREASDTDPIGAYIAKAPRIIAMTTSAKMRMYGVREWEFGSLR